MPRNIENMSRVYSPATWEVYDFLKQSLSPRGPDSLFEVAGEYVSAASVILDAGCRDAQHLIRLVQEHDAIGVGVDPVALHIERAKEAVAEAGLEARITLLQGVMHDLPY